MSRGEYSMCQQNLIRNQNDVYFSFCNELYHMILKAYIDKYLLEAIDLYAQEPEKENIQFSKSNWLVLEHICELVKGDFALLVWKIYLDSNEKANTITQLGKYLQKIGKGKTISTKISKQYNACLEDLKLVRRKFIAHNDKEKSGKKVDIKQLTFVLDEIKNMYNGLCDTSIDDRVQQITESDITAVGHNCILGLFTMIQG